MYPCANRRCADAAHPSIECPNLVRTDTPSGRNLLILAVLATLIVAALVLAAVTVGNR
ncbi:hypothetical protein [Nocardia brasiliensis]|uniref:hypothetical protein n=1 Tax=Nocardia brasiliensis TaxID=37326 RepID=UPI0002E03D0F|nr:hypothetical protein [Nocardia brasiliensis]